MVSQDDKREKEQIRIFELTEYSETNRGREYLPDAKIDLNGVEFTVELKSKPKFQCLKGKNRPYGSVSTARGFGPEKVEEWRSKTDLFLFGEHEDGVFGEQYVLTFDMLLPEIKKRVLDPYYNGRKKYYGENEFSNDILPLLEGKLKQSDLERFKHTFRNGAKLNDPKFSWAFIKEVGTLVSNKQDILDFISNNVVNRQ